MSWGCLFKFNEDYNKVDFIHEGICDVMFTDPDFKLQCIQFFLHMIHETSSGMEGKYRLTDTNCHYLAYILS